MSSKAASLRARPVGLRLAARRLIIKDVVAAAGSGRLFTCFPPVSLV